MNYYLLLLVLSSSLSFISGTVFLHSVEAFGTVTEYYWRDYHGIVPSDALAGGKNENDEITYIGQMSIIEANLIHTIPAIITNGNITAVGAFKRTAVASNSRSNLKVLCTRSPRDYMWHTRPSLVGVGCRYVVAGLEDEVPLYVGKAAHNKQIILGKIFSEGGRHYTGLIIPYEGVEYLPETYSILTHCA